MKAIKVEMTMAVEDNFVDQAKVWEHHAEYLLDLDSHPEILSVYDVTVNEAKEEIQ